MPEPQRVAVVGATGEIGRAICARLVSVPDYALVVLSRDPTAARVKVPGAVDYVAWQPATWHAWAPALDGAYAVINLASPPTFGAKWTPAYRAYMAETRHAIASGLVNAMRVAGAKPAVFISASSVGAYGFAGADRADVTEDTPPATDSYARESRAYEVDALRAAELGIRTVVPRTGFILDREGGGLPGMARSVRRFTGGVILPGTQYLPWIHIADEVSIIMRALADEGLRGAINATAPDVPTNRAFMRALGRALGRPVPMRVPAFVLRRFLGDGAAILTSGRRVVPRRLLDDGFQFQFPTLKDAFADLLR